MKYILLLPALCITNLNAGIHSSKSVQADLKIMGEIFQKEQSVSDCDNLKLLASCSRIMNHNGWSELDTNPITPNPNYKISFLIPRLTDFREKKVTFTYETTLNDTTEQNQITLNFGSMSKIEREGFLMVLRVLDLKK